MNECPVTIRGEYFPSQKAAAQKFGLTPSAISQSLGRHGHCDRVGVGSGVKGNTNAKHCPVRVGPFYFRSHLQASKQLGVSRSSVSRFAYGDDRSQAKEIVFQAAMAKFNAGELSEFLQEKRK